MLVWMLLMAFVPVLTVIAVFFYIFVLHSEFKYPYLVVKIDATGKEGCSVEDLIDEYIIENGIEIFNNHYSKVEYWKTDCEYKIAEHLFSSIKRKQYEKCLDDENMVKFRILSNGIRYKIIDGKRFPYRSEKDIMVKGVSINYILERYEELKKDI